MSSNAVTDRFNKRLLMHGFCDFQLRRYPAKTNPEELLKAFEDDGFVIVQSVPTASSRQ